MEPSDTPLVTDEDRAIARRWLREGQINVDQIGRAAVLVAMRQEYMAAITAEREECAKVAEALDAYRSYIDSSDEEVADSGLSRADLLAKARAIDPYDGTTPVAAAIRARGG